MTCDIVVFEPHHQPSFERLNQRWLEAHFRVEPIDAQVLGDPQTHIIKPGGQILMARVEHQIVGTCALKSHPNNELELTKMAVDPASQGLGIGNTLMQAAIAHFERCAGTLLWLETNHILAPAISLYEKYGFKRIGSGPRPGSNYQRSDYYMEWQPGQRRNPV